MSESNAQALWSRLQEADLVTGDRPALEVTAPWFVRVMLGVSGWIGALFLLGFVAIGLEHLIDSAGGSFSTGLLACGVAWFLLMSRPNSDFIGQFGLAVSLTGQVLVMIALDRWLAFGTGAMAITLGLFQVGLFFAMPSFAHRVWSAWAAATALALALADWRLDVYTTGLLSIACLGVWLNELRYIRYGAMFRAAGYGIVLALMGAMIMGPGNVPLWLGIGHSPSSFGLLTGHALGGFVLLSAVWQLLIREGMEPVSRGGTLILAAAAIVAVASMKAPGLAPATLILLLGFSQGNRVLAGLGVIALLGYLSFFYYSLEATLLYKSGLMGSTGFALLAARFALQQWWPAAAQRENNHA